MMIKHMDDKSAIGLGLDLGSSPKLKPNRKYRIIPESQ